MDMKVISKACGDYQTNCYIVTVDGKDIIIDPGVDAQNWVLDNVTNPIAIINTHGHFDHVWSNEVLKEKLVIPIYIGKGDEMLLQHTGFGFNMPISYADFEIEDDGIVNIDGVEVNFIHFAGHTAGSMVVEIGDYWFSGDFIFKNSIGRTDLPTSNPSDMKDSIKKFLKIDYNKKVYPGHGPATSIHAEQKGIRGWLDYL
jgi:glyoxylase-like metal-dependent hydrolase (beta-lactamase superfamily II)